METLKWVICVESQTVVLSIEKTFVCVIIDLWIWFWQSMVGFLGLFKILNCSLVLLLVKTDYSPV